MGKIHRAALVLSSALVLGACATDNNIQTSALPAKAEPKVDPACVQLTAQIDGLRKDGVAERIEKAAASKKTRLKQADLKKAAELNKANADFQARCATLTPTTAAAVSPPAPTPATAPAEAKAAAVASTAATTR